MALVRFANILPFSLTEKQSKLLAHCHTGNCSWKAILRELQIRRLLPFYNGLPAKAAKVAKAKPAKASVCYSFDESCYSKTASGFHFEMWDKSQPAQGSIVDAYLGSRKIIIPVPATIRLLPQAFHKPSGQNLSVMLARVDHEYYAQPVGVHRTFLKPDGSGKSDVTPNKMMLGAVTGGSAHLAEPTDTLAVAEGIENALSIQQSTGIPTWATLSCHGLKTLVLPPGIKNVLIFADHDSDSWETDVGLQAAYFAAERWSKQGLQVQVI
jgi:hypothetical protein